MSDLREKVSRAGKTILGDMVFNMLMAFALLFVILPHNPKKEEAVKRETSVTFGDMTILATWPNGMDIDIDLWVLCADDDKPVGYSNRAGSTCNLQRDDLGKAHDSTDLNFEMVSSRGLPAGEYIVNVHYFNNRETGGPKPPRDYDSEIPINVVISMRAKAVNGEDVGGMREAITRKAVLRVWGEEITVVRFSVDDDGNLIADSVNDLYKELRQWPTQ